ncbi:SCO3242 family prenyltransferase [Actinomadura macrotermitis]|uniref:4-hydroxybenzoate octaprenyltransferase n=1 Tax=Actinomadura macrotermitis TaxID=2585200 RepID=A0A7K0BXQ9_9ACTN|nr:UbiA family prenyltransferase [Actinomadura macrotermitis]MQY05971.1 4-hydroxybenzoate octaprenyltransferase [Actinomadura macrotermitis]
MNARDLAELVRAPAALTVPGDSLAGGARGLAPALASVCLYWAGMALNDYADRELDAKERPERPIPSGRVTPARALGVASGLTAAGLALAAVQGRRTLAMAAPLAAVVWSYDLLLKDTPAGPAAMAAARGLDVLLGGADSAAAGAVAAHTFGVTVLSRGEVTGGSAARAGVALAATGAAAALAARHTGPRRDRAARYGLLAAYAGTVGAAQLKAAREPDAATVRAGVGASILGVLPLQAGLIAGRGRPVAAAAVAALHPLARRLARKVSPT